jgi:coproporphyrinogen III oxidase
MSGGGGGAAGGFGQEVRAYLLDLQDRLCTALAGVDGGAARFQEDRWERAEGGGGRSRVLTGGALFEQAGVGYSHVFGATLPPAAAAHRPELAGRSFSACGVSLVLHPANPHVPAVHMNVRFFAAEGGPGDAVVWWFGGGYDLTPCYPYEADATAWHAQARAACAPFGGDVYPRFKRWCDEYFYLKPPRRDARRRRALLRRPPGVGFRALLRLSARGRRLASAGLPAHRRAPPRTPFGEREREFQLYRRGRYVEFNLLYDRGTLFGLQSGGRIESILMSLPPLVRWQVGWRAEPGSAEERLVRDFLRPRDWLGEDSGQAGG